jgi:hypothetical protein
MYGRTIALAVAACGWVIAGLIAFALVASFGFAAVGLMGLMMWMVCVRLELEKDGAFGTGRTPDLIVRQYEAREQMSEDQRAGWRHEQSLALQSTRFFMKLGMGLTAIGAAGFCWFQI